ncbi:MAG: glycerol-3-phosphate 1-O-acyltransferase PlsY [Crocinitomicaceae bacterium]|nr:glycerol-3-phosphate 1-O-acyltransferase PlsY [Crocinitomicaceae bacterium]
MSTLLFILLAYLLGSIPTAVWVGKSWYAIDVREHGSKNAGATNTFRVLGKKPGIIVLIIDIIKGAIASLLPFYFYTGTSDQVVNLQIITSIVAVVGHVFPCFANFKGGKGVATSLGVIIGLHPAAAGICMAVFLLVFLTSHYVSLGAMVGAITFPLSIVFIFHTHSFWLIVFAHVLAFLVILAHRKNIQRLLKGEESKMRVFKK